MRKIVIALPKGQRLLPQAYALFNEAGYTSPGLEAELLKPEGKLLAFDTMCGTGVFLLAKAADIPQYVDRNWAELGVSGFDCYREYELSHTTAQNSMRGDNFITDILPDLRLCGNSRFCVAGKPENKILYERCAQNSDKILTAATQHPNIAARYFAAKGVMADIVTVSGSTELMPKHGEVDVIFDIVETGRALYENDLIIFEEAMPIQTKILVSKAALKYDSHTNKIIGALKNAVKQKP